MAKLPLILTIRTDKPEAKVGLFADQKQLEYESWQADRQLAETIHLKIKSLLDKQNKMFQDISAITCFKGPGSFTGLRIGLTVGNALAYSLKIPIVSEMGDDWQKQAITRLLSGENERIALPEYGAEPHITKQKK